MKDEFLTNISHDLRSPLNSIIGFSELMADGLSGDLTADQQRQVEIIYKNARELLNMIDNIIYIAKLNTGSIQATIQPFELRSVLSDLERHYRPMIEKKKLRFSVELEETIPTIENDPLKVKRILSQLLENAIQYTDAGEIRLLGTYNRDNDTVEVTVHDTGRGIAKEDRPSLLKRCEPGALERSELHPHGRLGIGLTVALRTCDYIRGELSFESRTDDGSSFTLHFPRELAEDRT